MTRPNIVTRWFDAMSQRGLDRRAAIADFNSAYDTFYGENRWGEWEQGKRSIPDIIMRELSVVALPSIIEDNLGVRPTSGQALAILAALDQPKRARN